MPNIRIDEEVYDFLNSRGNTEDSFNDVIRRELGLEVSAKKRASRAAVLEQSESICEDQMLTGAVTEIIASMNDHLPAHWCADDSPKRQEQVFDVTMTYLVGTPKSLSPEERQKVAARKVAEKNGVTVETVEDKCARQLYGEGNGGIGRFRNALEGIEVDIIERKKLLAD